MFKILINTNARYPVDRHKIKLTAQKVLGAYGQEKKVEVSISFIGNRKMQLLNHQYRNIPQTTDILSFPLKGFKFPDSFLRLGDVVISYPQAQKQAGENNITVDEEIEILLKHGLLSLLGLEE